MIRFEFKKWGNGSGIYEVILLNDYNPISKRFKYTSLGMIKKNGSKWSAINEPFLIAASRKELAAMMFNSFENKKLEEILNVHSS